MSLNWFVRLWRRLFGQAWFRHKGHSASKVLQCRWCGEVKPTVVCEVWTIGDPAGHFVRLCRECGEGCAS